MLRIGLKLYIKFYIQGRSFMDTPNPAALWLSRSASAGISRDTGHARDSNKKRVIISFSLNLHKLIAYR